jgi:hypothetical protein
VGKICIPVSFLTLARIILVVFYFVSTLYYGFVIYSLYYVIYSLYSFYFSFLQWFYHEGVLNFVNGICNYWEDCLLNCFCLCAVLHLMVCICWTILPSLEWNRFCHAIWSFWYVVEFGLPEFC